MYRLVFLGVSGSLLAACAVASPGSTGAAKSGGAAGQLGPAYCHTVPSDPGERNRWNNLCFGRR